LPRAAACWCGRRLLGFAFQLRFIMVLLILLPLVEVTSAPKGKRFRLWFAHMLWFGVGFALFGWRWGLLAIGGALDDTSRRRASPAAIRGWAAPGRALRTEPPDYLRGGRLSFLFWALTRLVLTAPTIIGGFYGAFIARTGASAIGDLLRARYIGIAAGSSSGTPTSTCCPSSGCSAAGPGTAPTGGCGRRSRAGSLGATGMLAVRCC
jgi:hypothetical protein